MSNRVSRHNAFGLLSLSLGVVIIAVVLYPSPAIADCSATLTLTKVGDGCLTLSIMGAGSCNGPVDLALKTDSGAYVSQHNCPTSPCSQELGGGCWPCLQGTHSWSLEVNCMKPDPASTTGGCIADNAGHDSKTFSFDHKPSITDTDTVVGNGGVSGTMHFHAPDAWTDRVVSSEWLGGSSVDYWGSSVVLPPDAANYEAGFSAGPSSPARMLLLTVTACGDQKDSTVIAGVDNGCGDQTGGGGSQSCKLSDTGPAPCVGRPIKLANGNMQMTERDPLPGTEWFSLIRTYNSRGTVAGQTVAGMFGNGWTSFFDARLFIYQPQTLGTTVVEIRTASDSEYVFQNVSGNWVQMWPRGSKRAILTNTGGLYTLREPGSLMETVFDAVTGKPLRSHSRAFFGRDVSVSYSGGFPAHIADSWGNTSWTLTPDAANRIASITIDGTSLVWTYTYDAAGNLIIVTGPSSSLWRTYGYNGTRLTEARDASGNLIESHGYSDDLTHATSSIADQDDITSIITLAGRDNLEKLTRTTSGNGSTTDYYTRVIAGRARTVQIIGHCATCGTNDAVYAYDFSNGHLLREQDSRGYITAYTFDESDRVLSASGPYRPSGCDPATDSTHCRQTPASLYDVILVATPATLTTTYAYGDVNWPEMATATTMESILVPNQVSTMTVSVDPATGTVTQQATIGETGAPAQMAQYTTTTSLYDGTEGAAFNPGGTFAEAWLTLPQPPRLRKVSDGPRTDVADTTTWVYYPLDAAVPAAWRGRMAAIRNAAGHVIRFENYDVFGNAARVVDANGVATEYTFDPIGRVLTSTLKGVAGCETTLDPLCSTDIVSSRTYQPALGPLASTTLPRGGTTTYEYDNRGRTAATTRQVSATAYERIEYDYDPGTGRKSAERYLAGHPGVWSVTRSDAFQYDSFARLSEIDHPDGSKIVYHYDGANNLASVQDERHTTANTMYAYDPANRLASVTQMLSTTTGGQIATAYAYDIHGNLASVTDPNGNVTSYVYDDFGRMLSQTSPVTGTTVYSYDPAGNLISTTDGNGATTARIYDVLGRASSATSTRSGKATETVTWSYDGAAPFGTGRLALMTDPVGSTSYRYERRGLLIVECRTQGEQGAHVYDTPYRYDADGNRSMIGNVTYTFDDAGRPLSAQSSQPLVTGAAYLPFGPLTSLAFANGTTKAMTYDARYRPLTNVLTAGTTTLSSHLYSHDPAGNITSITDQLDPTYSRSFGYDDLNRLVTANTGSSLWGVGSYAYDAMGNMLSSALNAAFGPTTFSYVGTTSKLSAVTNWGPMTYDAAGNELSSGAFQWQYSARNLRTSEGYSSGGYGYDGRGVRVTREWSEWIEPPFEAMKADWLYSSDLHLLDVQTYGSTGTGYWNPVHTRQIIWFGDLPVAQYDIDGSLDALEEPTITLRYTFTDHLGTPTIQTDETGGLAWRAEYDPYGTIHTFVTGSRQDQPLRLPGQEDSYLVRGDVGDYYNIFRWYRAGWGRYTQADPIGIPGKEFPYASDNPVLNTDVLGLRDTSDLLRRPITRLVCETAGEGAGWVAGRALGLITLLLSSGGDLNPAEFEANRNCAKCTKGPKCRPCIPPVGTLAFREDTNPASPPHRGVPPPHWHLYEMHQSPPHAGCVCFWHPIPDNRGGFGASPPPPGTVPITPAAGGGLW